MTIIAVTGHRPDKLYGYNLNHPGWKRLQNRLKNLLLDLQPTLCISGMALGVDTVFALVVLELGIPLEAAIPCRGHEKIWNKDSQETYHSILAQASLKTLVTDQPYDPRLMQVRNEYMVNKCDQLIAVWDGSPGGTANCVRYAYKKNKPIIRLVPQKNAQLTLD